MKRPSFAFVTVVLSCASASPTSAAEEPYTLSATTAGSPVPLVAGGWSGDGNEAQLDLDFASVSPGSRTRFTATWTSDVRRAPKGFSTAATALTVERAPLVAPQRLTALPVLTNLHLESRQQIGRSRWSRWSGEKIRSYSDLTNQTEYVGLGSSDCIEVARPTPYKIQYRLTGSKGGTDASGITLTVKLGGSECG